MTEQTNQNVCRAVPERMGSFLTVWIGQLFSQIGFVLTTFGLGVWLFQQTGSISKFSAITVAHTVPFILLSPMAGVLADRWDRRSLMVLANCVAAARALVFLFLIGVGKLSLLHICVATGVTGIAASLGNASYNASIVMMVSKENLGRANGMTQFVIAVAQVVAPISGGLMLAKLGLSGVLITDLACCVVAVLVLLTVRVPNPPRHSHDDNWKAFKSFSKDISLGIGYLRARPGVQLLATFVVSLGCVIGMAVVLFQPMVLGFATPVVLGRIGTTCALGMVIGSLGLSFWGGPKRKAASIIGASAVCSLCIIAVGAKASALWIGIGGFAFFLICPALSGCIQALLQESVEPGFQGRVFSLITFAAGLFTSVGLVVAGPVSDRFLELWLASDGPLAKSVGRVIGTGQGRGIAMLFVLTGICCLAATCLVYYSRSLVSLERKLNQAVPSPPAGDQPSQVSVNAV